MKISSVTQVSEKNPVALEMFIAVSAEKQDAVDLE